MFSIIRNPLEIFGKLRNIKISEEIAQCSNRNSFDCLSPAFSGMRKILNEGWYKDDHIFSALSPGKKCGRVGEWLSEYNFQPEITNKFNLTNICFDALFEILSLIILLLIYTWLWPGISNRNLNQLINYKKPFEINLIIIAYN